MNNIFEIATREKYRYPYKGIISTEDLWDLPLESLDSIFKALNQKRKLAQEESLLYKKTSDDTALENKILIVRHIVTVKQEESRAKMEAKANKEKKEKLLAILADKEDEAYRNMSQEEIKKLIADM